MEVQMHRGREWTQQTVLIAVTTQVPLPKVPLPKVLLPKVPVPKDVENEPNIRF